MKNIAPMFSGFAEAFEYMEQRLEKSKILVLIRHGESQANLKDVFQGWKTKDPLTEKGRRQAESLRDFLLPLQIEHFVSSDSERALQTSEIIPGKRKTKIDTRKNLRELDFGKLSRMTHEGQESDLAKKFPKLYETFQGNVENFVAPSGEKFIDLKARVEKELDILKNKKPSSIALVSHFWWIREAIRELENANSIYDIPSVEKTGITIFEITNDPAKLLLFNNTEHLGFTNIFYWFEEKNNLASLKYFGQESKKEKETIRLRWKQGMAHTKDFPSFMVAEACKEIKPSFSAISLFAELGLDAILLLKYKPKLVLAADISKQQIQMIKTNIAINSGKADNARVVLSNLFESIPETKVDLITANPPQTPNKGIFENGQLPEGGTGPYEPDGDGLGFFRRIFENAGKFLKPKGSLFFSFQDFLGAEKLMDIAEKNNFVIEEIIDFPGRSRVFPKGKTEKNLAFIESLANYKFFTSSNKTDDSKYDNWKDALESKNSWYQKKLLKARKK